MDSKRIAFLFLLVTLVALQSCTGGKNSGKAGKTNSETLLDFPGNGQVTRGEFEYVYQKNNGGWEKVKEHTVAQYQEYLDLYINFKRKVMEAQKMGLADTPEFKSEFEGYRKQLAQPYLVEKSVQENLIREAYDRSKTLVEASHVLINCGADADPADTLKAYNKAMDLRASILKGEKTFEEVAKTSSDDPSAKDNAGYLGYFTAFDMVYPFESGAFNTPIGDVSTPVRSGYGYHLIKVKDKVQSTGKKTAAHIMIRVGKTGSAKNDEQAKAKLEEIVKKLEKGDGWDELVLAYSDDGTTKNKGGSLGNGRLIPEMENLKMKLGDGEISEPFQTNFGWHLLKVVKVEPLKTFEEAKPELKSRISRDARSFLSREKLIERVKKEYGYTENKETVSQLNDIAKNYLPEYSKGFWKPTDSVLGNVKTMELYSIGDKDKKQSGTVADYIKFIGSNRKGYDNASVQQVTRKNMEAYIEAEMLRYEEQRLPEKYPEYRELLKEYRDGILLFTLTEDKVWRKAVDDTTGLQNYYNSNKDKFQAAERIRVAEFISESPAAIEQIGRLLAKGHNENYIDSTLNADNPLTVRTREQTYEKGKAKEEAELFSKSVGSYTGSMSYGKAQRVLLLKEHLPAGIKPFEDARAEAITLYQNYLEAEWLAELEGKYPVKVNEDVLNKLFK